MVDISLLALAPACKHVQIIPLLSSIDPQIHSNECQLNSLISCFIGCEEKFGIFYREEQCVNCLDYLFTVTAGDARTKTHKPQRLMLSEEKAPNCQYKDTTCILFGVGGIRL